MVESEWDYAKEYASFSKVQKLPSLEIMEADFEIGKTLDKKTSFFAREIRRAMMEKISAYAQLFESFLSPSSSQVAMLSLLKKISSEERVTMKAVYQRLSQLQFEALKLDAIYIEQQEISFIKHANTIWQATKQEIFTLLSNLESRFHQDTGSAEKSYLG